MSAQQLSQLEEQLSLLESQGSIFFDKVEYSLSSRANALTNPYSQDDARKHKDTILQSIETLENLLQQTNVIYLSEQNPEDSLQKLKAASDNQLAALYKDKERMIKNIEKTRNVVLKQ